MNRIISFLIDSILFATCVVSLVKEESGNFLLYTALPWLLNLINVCTYTVDCC